jgi:hypothetical protein
LTKLLKICSDYISVPLSYLCNQSLIEGTFPEQLKYSKGKPLYKKGEKSCIYNYRPISLLTSFSKILEKVMYKQVIDCFNSNNILTKEQSGFRKGLSTDKALYKFLDEILCALNDKMHVGGIICDLAKAFDCVNHDISLLKQNLYGIKGKAGQCFKSYLNGRKQE